MVSHFQRSSAASSQELQSFLKDVLGKEQATFLSNGSYLQLGECGYVVAVDKPGWLSAETISGVVITKGDNLVARSTLNSPYLLPIVNLESILRTGGSGIAIDEVFEFAEVDQSEHFRLTKML